MTKLELLRSIRHGDVVRARFPNGAGQPWIIRKGRANGLLLFPDHVVINLGGRHGTPAVVTESNLETVNGLS